MLTVNEWSKTFTWHGVSDAVGSRRGHRRFWISVLLVTSALMVWQLYSVINNYLIFPKYQTSVTTQVQSAVEFPNITICNYNRVNLTRMKELNISDATLSYLYLGLPQNYKISSVDLNTTAPLKDAYDLWKRDYTGSFATEDIFMDLGHSCESTLLLCIFGGPSYSCCDNVRPVVNQYGKCLSLIPGEEVSNGQLVGDRAVQYDPGPQGAMSLVIDPQLNEYSNVIVNDLISEGVMLLVTNEPEMYQIEDLISLEPGTVALVSLSVAKSYVSDPVYRVWPLPCKRNATLQYMSGQYTHNKCSTECYIKTVVDYCNCGFATKLDLNVTRCTPEAIDCINDLWYGTADWALPGQTYFEQCTMTGCDVPCEPRYTFTTRVSKTIMSSSQTQQMQQVYTQLLSNPKANINDLIQVDIYYPQIELTVKETAERTSVFDLMSSIGGQIGLWGGMSVISLIQLVHFLCRTGGPKLKLLIAKRRKIFNDRSMQTSEISFIKY